MLDTGTCPSVGYFKIFNFTPKIKCLSVIPMFKDQESDTGTWSKIKSPSNIGMSITSKKLHLKLQEQLTSKTKLRHVGIVACNVFSMILITSRARSIATHKNTKTNLHLVFTQEPGRLRPTNRPIQSIRYRIRTPSITRNNDSIKLPLHSTTPFSPNLPSSRS